MSCIGSTTGSVYCNETRSCMNQSYDEVDTRFVYGYKGAFGPLTSWAGDGLRCDGSFSCNSMSFMTAKTDGLYCGGSESCSNSNARADRTVYCHASNACSGANISSAGTAVHCNGYQSCANAYINDTPLIQAGGQFALFNATIDTTGSSNMVITIRLDGSLAGYGAKLFCDTGYTCNIYCYGYDSCYMFYTECAGTCSVTPWPDVIVPITDLAEFNTQYVARDMEATMDESCMQDAVTFDDKGLFSHDTICTFSNTNLDIDITTAQERSVCCRGMCACGLISIDMQTDTKQSLLCSAYQSCHQSAIAINNNTIYCEAKGACTGSASGTGSTIRAGAVYCSGFEACYQSVVYVSRFVECRGDRSCEYTSVISDGRSVDLFLTGHQAGWHLSLYCNDTDVCNVYCTGYDSCADMNLFCNGNCNTIGPKPLTNSPSTDSTLYPTRYPSKNPTKNPTLLPTISPTTFPTLYPTLPPTSDPSESPTFLPTFTPTETSLSPIATPTAVPTASNATPTAIPITDISPLIQTTNTIATFVTTNHVTPNAESTYWTDNKPPPSSSPLSAYVIGIILAGSTLVVIGVIYVLWVCFRRMLEEGLANNDINNVVINVADDEYENDAQQTKKREHVTKGGAEDIVQHENKGSGGVGVIRMGTNQLGEGDRNRRGTNQFGEGDNDESGDSDDMYIDKNAELKGDDIEDGGYCNDETTKDKEVENEKGQGTKGDVYYDEYYDKIWKREVNKK